MRLICLTGLTGAGKTTVKDILNSFDGVQSFYTRELTRNPKAKKRTDPESLKNDMLQHGQQFQDDNGFIKNCFDLILARVANGTKIVVFDSVRSPKEFEFIQNFYSFDPVDLLHIYCNDKTRYERLKQRDDTSDELIALRDSYDLGSQEGSNHNFSSLVIRANYKVDTSGDVASIKKQLERIYRYDR